MQDLIKIIDCLEKKPELVKVFGAIFYANRHPNIKKALKDSDYWDALHEISGERWAIFSVQAKDGNYSLPSLPPGYLGLMIPIWNEPRENRKLLEFLEIESSEDPYFITFTRLNERKILKSKISLNDNSVDEAFSRIRKVVTELTDAIELIEKDNIQDYESVFNAVDMTVSRITNIDNLRKIFGIYQYFKNIKP